MSVFHADSELSTISKTNERELPPYDEALDTKKRYYVGLLLSFILSIALIACGISSYVFANRARNKAIAQRLSYPTEVMEDGSISSGPIFDAELYYPTLIIGPLSTVPKEISNLAFNTIVTGTTECLGYIHSVSLRWALYHESRLHHNSNLRLFTSARLSAPNSWYANALWTLLLVISYSCASQILITTDNDLNTIGFNSLALVVLGACLLSLSLLTASALLPRYACQILSWNSDPLNTTLALLHSTWSRPSLGPPSYPLPRQPSIRALHPQTQFIVAYFFFLIPTICIGAGVLIYANRGSGLDITFINPGVQSGTFISLVPVTINPLKDHVFWQAGAAIQIFFLAAMMVLYTVALHALEQLVNYHRDEASWRASSKAVENGKGGAVVGRESVKAAATAWQTVVLGILKPVTHWLFGLAVVIDPARRVDIHPMPLFALAGIAMLLAAFAVFLTYHRPSGAQPAAYGDLRLLAALIDDWGDGAGGKLFWGDKGRVVDGDEEVEVRSTGTSARLEKIGTVLSGLMYTGLGGEVGELQKRGDGKGRWWRSEHWRRRKDVAPS